MPRCVHLHSKKDLAFGFSEGFSYSGVRVWRTTHLFSVQYDVAHYMAAMEQDRI